MKERNKRRIRCPYCGSSQAYVRRTTHQIVCQSCGHVSEAKLQSDPTLPSIEKDFTKSPKV